MQLQALRYFAMVAATGSFAATARHFQVPASSVSRFVAALERELGQQLLYRNTRSVRLTEGGERYYLQLREILDALDVANEEAVGQDTEVRGLVRINAPVALGRLHIAALVGRLQGVHPGLDVELTLTDALIDPIQEGADITVRIGQLNDSALIGRTLAEQHYVVCASPAYLRRHGRPKTPEDLLAHRCLVYKGTAGAQRWFFRRAPDEAPQVLQVRGPLSSNNAEVLVAAAKEGRGIVMFPTWLFDHACFSSRTLVRLLPGWIASEDAVLRRIHLISPENRLRSRKVRVVLDFLIEAIGSPPCWDTA